MKRSHTGIIVIILLTLIIVNNIYNPGMGMEGVDRSREKIGTTEGFDIYSKWGHNESDSTNRYIISVKQILKKQPGQTDVDFVKAQIINMIRMFNANFEDYIQKVYNTKDFLNPNISIDLIVSVLNQLFDYIKTVIHSARSTYGDTSLSTSMRTTITTYCFNAFDAVNTKLLLLTNNPAVVSGDISLFTEEQITDPDYNGEPSIQHFVIICDDTSKFTTGLIALQNTPVPTRANVNIDIFISNLMNGANNANFLLSISNGVATLQNTPTGFSDYATSKKYNKNPGQSSATMDSILAEVASNNVDVYKIYESNTSGPFFGVMALMFALLIAIGYYFYDMQDHVATSGPKGNIMASIMNASKDLVSKTSAGVSAMGATVANGASTVSSESSGKFMKTVNSMGGLFLIHAALVLLFVFLFVKFHGGDGLQDIKDAVEKVPDIILKENKENVNSKLDIDSI